MIVIDAGHGGSDPGSSGNGIIEKDLNLAISQYMYDRFRELGIPVTMTRTTDETVTPAVRAQRILNAYGNNPNVIVLSNHINAGGGDGAEVIYALRNNSRLSNLILEEIAREGQNIRDAYQRRLPSDPSKDYYFIHRETGVTQPVIIEYGFLDSPGDDVAQLKSNHEKYSEAVVRAVMRYLNSLYTPPTGINSYVVKSGDSLWSISKQFNVNVEELKSANNLMSNLLTVGQILTIPTSTLTQQPGEYTVYTVVAGDSLYEIARKYNITVNELIQYNNLSSANLSVGQQILIPSVAVTPPVEKTDYLIYRVQLGDSLYAIARKYNTTVNELMAINNLSTNVLNIGQELKIPTKESTTPVSNYIEYIVKSGDSLYAIANKYNTTVNEIVNLNSLTSNNLSIGQRLRIPTRGTPITYTVKSGDNLYGIANKYNTTVNEIKTKNNLISNNLNIGQILIL